MEVNQQEQQPLITKETSNPSSNPLTTPTSPTVQEDAKQIQHQVHYGDTLEGLSLQYSVPINKIKQRNSIETDNIYHLKKIIIPNPSIPFLSNQNQHNMKIEEMMLYMLQEDKSSKSAKYYLLQANWDLNIAIKTYRQDVQWEKKNPMKSIPIVQLKQTKYTEIQLINKKKQ